jgi:putative nucleotidyltransferase with HDIG domain
MLISDGHKPTLHDQDTSISDQTVSGRLPAAAQELLGLLERTFGTPFTLIDATTGEVLSASSGQPQWDQGLFGELCREVSRRNRVELIAEEGPVAVLAVPCSCGAAEAYVATALFITRPLAQGDDLPCAAERLGMSATEISFWAVRQTAWSPSSLERVGELVRAQLGFSHRIRESEIEARSLSVSLASTYEEISLLHRLTQHLKISESDEDLGRITLQWMADVLPARGLVLQLIAAGSSGELFHCAERAEPMLLTYGDCQIDQEQFAAIIDYLGPGAAHRPYVFNRVLTALADWHWPQIRQMIAIAMAEGENTFGWIMALNHVEDAEFGTIEANLLSSVAAILGIHSGNIELYRQQSELLAGIVRALTSAIDAKDPYTRGHSDRVARVAVCLAQELGCDAKTVETIYLSGLLHDIGKIGVDDQVLRKAARLSDAEYEHVKKHSETGYRILRDLQKLGDVLPVVLHHHESWDGSGYPKKLGAEAIPLTARIVAVADAYDAMGSDRPYRKGMPVEKIDAIFHAGAGQQWDPRVVEAFFRVRGEIEAISRTDPNPAELSSPIA